MSRFEFKLPDIGEGVTEGEIVSWLVSVGDTVAEDQDIVEVMTDKATVTIGAPKAGTVAELRGSEGDVIPVGDVLVVFDSAGRDSSTESRPPAPSQAPAPKEAPASTEAAASAVGDIKEELPGMSRGEASGYFNEKPLAAPATRKMARELGLDLRRIEPTGPAGRVTREDVERFKNGAPIERARGGDGTSARAGQPALPPPAPPTLPHADSEDRRVPIRGLRRRIFENMARSMHTAAHFTYVDECDATALRTARARAKDHAAREGVNLTFLPFIVKAVVASLRRHPALNCLVDDEAQEMILKGSYDIGIAVATDSGLTVPVLRGADRLSLLEIAREIERLSADARDGKTRREDLGRSSFTITSLGKQGGLFATPVVNYPEVAILGVHEMKQKPVVRGDEIVVGSVMLLSLSFDHRIIDGHVGAAFAAEVIGYLEQPERLFVEMR